MWISYAIPLMFVIYSVDYFVLQVIFLSGPLLLNEVGAQEDLTVDADGLAVEWSNHKPFTGP